MKNFFINDYSFNPFLNIKMDNLENITYLNKYFNFIKNSIYCEEFKEKIFLYYFTVFVLNKNSKYFKDFIISNGIFYCSTDLNIDSNYLENIINIWYIETREYLEYFIINIFDYSNIDNYFIKYSFKYLEHMCSYNITDFNLIEVILCENVNIYKLYFLFFEFLISNIDFNNIEQENIEKFILYYKKFIKFHYNLIILNLYMIIIKI